MITHQIRKSTVLCLTILIASFPQLFAEVPPALLDTYVSGTVVSAEDNQPLPGVNVTVQGKIIGTSTDSEGNFELNISQDPPLTLVFSIVGFRTQEVEITTNERTDLRITMEEQTIMGSDVVVSASRVEESILEAPVTIEKMDVINIRNTPSDDYYKSLSHLKGVDMTSNSINFQVINSRGFNSTGNTRMVQLIDGMDTQAPALNFPIGNLNGPNELDVESIEYLPGAASALYGPNAFNGILLINSKDPFQYQGLSVMLKSGVNHINGNESLGEPGNPQSTTSTAIRYARAINNKFAFKLNFAYSQAEDWYGINFTDKNEAFKGSNLPAEARNPAYDGIHSYGDDGSFNIALLGLSSNFIERMSQQFGLSPQNAQQYAASIPSQPVNRTGYDERHLVDYGAENLKFNSSLHYRLSDQLEASYTLNYGYGTSVYTGAQRYSLKNFNISQHKLQLEGSNFLLKGYGTFEDSGDSYIADFVGYYINGVSSDPMGSDPSRGNQAWYGTYGGTIVGALVNQVQQATGSTDYNQTVVNGVLNNPAALAAIYNQARMNADGNRYEPGSTEFENAKDAALQNTIPDGALFDDESRFYHLEGQYNFSNHIDFANVILGANFRQFQLRSNGTIFDDAGGRNINEWGTYLQASKAFLEDQVQLTGSVRYDKNENFDGQFSPRLSGVFSIADNQNIRASFQTGFRNPSTQGQYIDLNVVTARLLGGLQQFANKYSVTTNSYTFESVQELTNTVLEDPTTLSDPAKQTAAINNLDPYSTHDEVKPEQIQAYEIGYKGLIGDKLLIDAAYYYNIYDDFITQIRVRRAAGSFVQNPSTPAEFAQNGQVAASLLSGDFNNTFQIYTNVDNSVEAHGAVFGANYSLPAGYQIGVNYNWNKLISDLETFQNDFNTPEHKINVTFGNRNLTERLGFNIAYRWQDAFRWESSFAFQDVEAITTVDAQINYQIPEYNATLKVGGSDLFNKQYVMSGGGPQLGAIYYISLTFDQLFR
ncbi:TonB-dependent receptor [Aliifodinibius sp. S!AR15-10]|uniref:TonB-dependent receptor n=1 Tax=Aliifodinibius sp. S!AR15-10 TaxID=2950437 RepID=UPI00286612C1|nr:TonB-dependent receptor [Aliifodinibius sp. S!AR15-10]MDR8393524.1 TonB-dependent receptor [Aliifodinibius sp. S!AR15-10]